MVCGWKPASAGRGVAEPVAVRSGIVTVTGSVQRRADALGLLGAIRHAEGVVGVRDRLSYPPAG